MGFTPVNPNNLGANPIFWGPSQNFGIQKKKDLGLIPGKCFSTTSIWDFLGLSPKCWDWPQLFGVEPKNLELTPKIWDWNIFFGEVTRNTSKKRLYTSLWLYECSDVLKVCVTLAGRRSIQILSENTWKMSEYSRKREKIPKFWDLKLIETWSQILVWDPRFLGSNYICIFYPRNLGSQILNLNFEISKEKHTYLVADLKVEEEWDLVMTSSSLKTSRGLPGAWVTKKISSSGVITRIF